MNNTINYPNANILNVDIRYFKRITSPAMIKQEIWRQKQIQKYYIHGRPIFGQPKNDFRY